jgi:hypothetical protein
MQKIEIKDGMLFVSNDTHWEYEIKATEDFDLSNGFTKEAFGRHLNEYICFAVQHLFFDRINREDATFLEEWKCENSGLAILDAHGGRTADGTWYFRDGKHQRTVQSWIDGLDGRYGTLALLVCNEFASLFDPPETRKSLLFVPEREVGGDLMDIRDNFLLKRPVCPQEG